MNENISEIESGNNNDEIGDNQAKVAYQIMNKMAPELSKWHMLSHSSLHCNSLTASTIL